MKITSVIGVFLWGAVNIDILFTEFYPVINDKAGENHKCRTDVIKALANHTTARKRFFNSGSFNQTDNKMGKKRKHEDKEIEKDKEETGQQIKSIADLFASSSTDPALEALFKQNVLALLILTER